MSTMLIVAIGWLYVVLMLALTKSTLWAAVSVVVFYGLLPLGVILYIVGFPRRARLRKQQGDDAGRRAQELDANPRTDSTAGEGRDG
jgi:predicted membrane channel-forming protein YqfA (hemolysin III family)